MTSSPDLSVYTYLSRNFEDIYFFGLSGTDDKLYLEKASAPAVWIFLM